MSFSSKQDGWAMADDPHNEYEAPKRKCTCCDCNKRVKATFALAWIAGDPDMCQTQPQGFQFDYVDTAENVYKKLQEFDDWMKQAPIADCTKLVMKGAGKFLVANGILNAKSPKEVMDCWMPKSHDCACCCSEEKLASCARSICKHRRQ
ncbi:uncharacterized protein LOC109599353 [Aethina tumida]|uniref:uncharacterized protein LOC109599353 n=1 Tax=Aethina tumida TaxID=116153 RepID=UPI00096B37F5|nr:uncharacterized protein LOC109599353 [Aethina tumida]